MRLFLVALLLALLMGTVAAGSAHATSSTASSSATSRGIPVRVVIDRLARTAKPVLKHSPDFIQTGFDLLQDELQDRLEGQQARNPGTPVPTPSRRIIDRWICGLWLDHFDRSRDAWARATWNDRFANYAWDYCIRNGRL